MDGRWLRYLQRKVHDGRLKLLDRVGVDAAVGACLGLEHGGTWRSSPRGGPGGTGGLGREASMEAGDKLRGECAANTTDQWLEDGQAGADNGHACVDRCPHLGVVVRGNPATGWVAEDDSDNSRDDYTGQEHI